MGPKKFELSYFLLSSPQLRHFLLFLPSFQAPICNLNLCLQPDITPETAELPEGRVADFQTNIRTIREAGYGKFDTIHKADLKISDIGNLLGSDWVKLAHELEIPDSDINIIKTEYPENEGMYSSRFRIFF